MMLEILHEYSATSNVAPHLEDRELTGGCAQCSLDGKLTEMWTEPSGRSAPTQLTDRAWWKGVPALSGS
jgi:hypothetical protein